jgi:hypothetical protein
VECSDGDVAMTGVRAAVGKRSASGMEVSADQRGECGALDALTAPAVHVRRLK